MLNLSRNVHFQSLLGQLDNIVEAIKSVSHDILTLQKVTTSLVGDMKCRLENIALHHPCFSGEGAPSMAMRKLAPIGRLKRKVYQFLIASYWPVEGGGNRWHRRTPYPELLTRVTREEITDLIEWDVE